MPGAEGVRVAVADGTAVAAAKLLPLVGYAVHPDPADRSVLRAADGHGVRVGTDCDGLSVLILFVSAVAVSPVPLGKRALFAVLGAIGILLANQVRIGHLLWLSNRDPDAFRTAHETWWPAGLLGAAALAFLLWARRVGRPA